MLELRCPDGMGKLLGKVRRRAEPPWRIADDLIELHCSNCRRTMNAAGTDAARVLHRFNFLGELIETEVVSRADLGSPPGS